MSVVKKLYVLECTNGKYYVGVTLRTLDYRINEHLTGYGSEWTKYINQFH